VDRDALVAAIGTATAELQGAYDDRDRALAERLGIGRTDLRCLDLLIREGPTTAARLGPRLHLTRGSMTSLVQRLENARYIDRHDDPDHGRRRIIAASAHLVARITPLVADLASQGARQLEQFDTAELDTIHRYLQGTLARQTEITASYRR
jgi:DNA-binding MarR family transcriptional regulator